MDETYERSISQTRRNSMPKSQTGTRDIPSPMPNSRSGLEKKTNGGMNL